MELENNFLSALYDLIYFLSNYQTAITQIGK